MMNLLHAVIFAAAVASSSEAPPESSWALEPTSYRDVPFTATMDDLKKKLPAAKCSNRGVFMETLPPGFTGRCKTTFKLKDGVTLSEEWTFIDGRLGTISASFPVAASTFVRSVFVEKYGSPTTETTKRENALDTRPIDALVWNGSGVTLTVDLYYYLSSMGGGSGLLVFRLPNKRETDAVKDAARKF